MSKPSSHRDLRDSYQGLMVAGDAGAVAGGQAAACILSRRLAADNAKRSTPDTFIGSTEAGAWRPTTLLNGVPVGLSGEFLATMVPFAAKTSDQFRTENHAPHLESGAYTKAYQEVLEKGGNTATGHTRRTGVPTPTPSDKACTSQTGRSAITCVPTVATAAELRSPDGPVLPDRVIIELQ